MEVFMKRTLVFSDIHGELVLFDKLLQKVNYNSEQDQLILLGDYIDRGPNSKGVIERVIELKESGAIVLKGNHDDLLVKSAHRQLGALEYWERAGGLSTLKSYDVLIENMKIPDNTELKKHVIFLENLDYYHECENYIFVHAGIEPGTRLSEQDSHTYMWIRELFYEVYNGDKTVVFGHTPVSLIRGNSDHDIYFGGNNIIGIDGAAAYGGQLNCLELPSKRTFHVKALNKRGAI